VKTAKDLKIPFSWSERRPILLDRFFYIPGHYNYFKEKIPFFEQDLPVIVEYCSGNGQWICERALQNRGTNWIAVEKKFERARKIWLNIHRQEIPNLVVVCGEGQIFTKYYAPKTEEVYINFPDPWPKLRHAKNRIVQEEFLNDLTAVVTGKITCVTDDLPYANQMVEVFSKCPKWKKLFHTNEWPDYGRSFFNDLWVKKGRVIQYLSYEIIS